MPSESSSWMLVEMNILLFGIFLISYLIPTGKLQSPQLFQYLGGCGNPPPPPRAPALFVTGMDRLLLLSVHVLFIKSKKGTTLRILTKQIQYPVRARMKQFKTNNVAFPTSVSWLSVIVWSIYTKETNKCYKSGHSLERQCLTSATLFIISSFNELLTYSQ